MKKITTLFFILSCIMLNAQTFNYILKESPNGTFNVVLESTSNLNTDVEINFNQTFLYIRVPIDSTISLSGGWNVTQTTTDSIIQLNCGVSYGFDLIEISPNMNIFLDILPMDTTVILTSFALEDDAFAFMGTEACIGDVFENSLQVDIDGGDASFNTQALAGSTILPIYLSNFTAQKVENQAVQLDWISYKEVNSSHFIVQRSDNGNNFLDIGRVEAAGNSHLPLEYVFIDRDVIVLRNSSKIVYYRLKLIDIDNYTDYSEIRAVRFDRQGFSDVSIYPNPTTDILHLDVNENLEETIIRYQILDTQGRILADSYIDISKQKLHLLPLQNMGLQPGIYFIKLRSQKELLSSQKFVIISQ